MGVSSAEVGGTPGSGVCRKKKKRLRKSNIIMSFSTLHILVIIKNNTFSVTFKNLRDLVRQAEQAS